MCPALSNDRYDTADPFTENLRTWEAAVSVVELHHDVWWRTVVERPFGVLRPRLYYRTVKARGG